MSARTNIVINEKLMQDVLRETGCRTKREAVDQALRMLLRLKRQERVRQYRGKLRWEGDLGSMRTDS